MAACGHFGKRGWLSPSRRAAGHEAGRFYLEVKDGTLTLSGERKFDEAANGVQYHRVERAADKFTRMFSLPRTVNSGEIRASYRDGILEIHVPKAEEAKPKQISVSVN